MERTRWLNCTNVEVEPSRRSEVTAIVWGMPGELVKNGGAGLIKPVDEIAAAIIEWVEVDALH